MSAFVLSITSNYGRIAPGRNSCISCPCNARSFVRRPVRSQKCAVRCEMGFLSTERAIGVSLAVGDGNDQGIANMSTRVGVVSDHIIFTELLHGDLLQDEQAMWEGGSVATYVESLPL